MLHTVRTEIPSEYVIEILSRYNQQYKQMIDNLCEIVLTNVLLHIISGEKITELDIEEEARRKLQNVIQMENLSDLRTKLKTAVHVLIRDYYENDEKLMEYLFRAVDNITIRIKNAADKAILFLIL